MSFFELLLVAVGLSMDAFAVAVCKGLSVYKLRPRHAIITGLYFGGFQALMPLIGYLLGSTFSAFIKDFDHWIAFLLLTLIGGNMIVESFKKDDDGHNDSFSVKTMIPLAVATSIDALAIGVSFSFLIDFGKMCSSVLMIGVTTFILSVLGIYLGNIFGTKFKSKAEFAGGGILIFMGIKILVEHLITKS